MSKLLFYLPKGWEQGRTIPDSLDGNWTTLGDSSGLVYLTYFIIRAGGLEAEIISEFPKQGIVVSHSAFLVDAPYRHQVFYISLQFDYPRNPVAHLHIAPNLHKASHNGLTLAERIFWPGHTLFLPHMPQLGLIPRNKARGLICKKIGYFGLEKNVDPSLLSKNFLIRLNSIGCVFTPKFQAEEWADYSDIDAVIAIRTPGTLIANKPAQKLYNCWLAGVIPIMGPEVGFREAGRIGVDYIEVDCIDEALKALDQLRMDPEYFWALLENGQKKSQLYNPSRISRIWVDSFRTTIIPEASKWLAGPILKRQLFILTRKLRARLQTIISSSPVCLSIRRKLAPFSNSY